MCEGRIGLDDHSWLNRPCTGCYWFWCSLNLDKTHSTISSNHELSAVALVVFRFRPTGQLTHDSSIWKVISITQNYIGSKLILPRYYSSCLLTSLNQGRTSCGNGQQIPNLRTPLYTPSIETFLPSTISISHISPQIPHIHCAIPTVSSTSACLLPVVAKLLKTFELLLPVLSADFAKVCRSIMSSRALDKEKKLERRGQNLQCRGILQLHSSLLTLTRACPGYR